MKESLSLLSRQSRSTSTTHARDLRQAPSEIFPPSGGSDPQCGHGEGMPADPGDEGGVVSGIWAALSGISAACGRHTHHRVVPRDPEGYVGRRGTHRLGGPPSASVSYRVARARTDPLSRSSQAACSGGGNARTLSSTPKRMEKLRREDGLSHHDKVTLEGSLACSGTLHAHQAYPFSRVTWRTASHTRRD